MFAKIFGQILDSSIAEDYDVRRMFMDMLILSDSDGVVDMTHDAISRRLNVPLDKVTAHIAELMKPDPTSRSKKLHGSRIVLLDSHRDWGWKIVNYAHYRAIRDEEGRRGYFRDYMRDRRAKKRKQKAAPIGENVNGSTHPVKKVSLTITPVNTSKLLSTHAEAEAEAEGKKKDVRPIESARQLRFPTGMTDSEWLARLCQDKTYEGIDVMREHGKAINWCAAHSKTLTRRRFINWLNKSERPMAGGNGTHAAPRALSFDERRKAIESLKARKNEIFREAGGNANTGTRASYSPEQLAERAEITSKLERLEAV